MRQGCFSPKIPGPGVRNKLVYHEPQQERFMLELYETPGKRYFYVLKELDADRQLVERSTGLNELKMSLAYNAAMKIVESAE